MSHSTNRLIVSSSTGFLIQLAHRYKGLKGWTMVDDENTRPTSDEQSAKRETSLLNQQADHPAMSDRAESAAVSPSRLSTPWRLLMQIGGTTQTTVGIEVRDKIIIGRSDPVANFYPDLDLTPYGGQDGGVSRRHATIVQIEDDQALYLEDLGSTNGTRINGFSLEPKRRYRLRDGDELEFGEITMVLRVVRSPFE